MKSLSLLLFAGRLLPLTLFAALELQAQPPPERAEPRTVAVLYDGQSEPEPAATLAHRLLELPLNYLGLRLEYFDLRDGLPAVRGRSDVRGALSCLSASSRLADPAAYLTWIEDLIQDNKRFAFICRPLWLLGRPVIPEARLREFWRRLGVQDSGREIDLMPPARPLSKDPRMIDFERPLGHIGRFRQLRVTSGKLRSHLRAAPAEAESALADVVFTAPWGGYASEDAAFRCRQTSLTGEPFCQWQINPFEFFEQIFDTARLAKPDATTFAGRRIFHALIGREGFSALTEIPALRASGGTAAAVMQREIFDRFPGLPFTVATPAAADAQTGRAAGELLPAASRFTNRFPSYSGVTPVGIRGKNVYAAYMFSEALPPGLDLPPDAVSEIELQETIKNTETPKRVKPLGFYYTFRAGIREDALRSIRDMAERAAAQDLCLLTSAHYAAIARGFDSASLTVLGPERWRIRNRGELQTVRFDHASLKTVNLPQSAGVIGQRHFQGSLYVYLDRSQSEAVIELQYRQAGRDRLPVAGFLVASRWRVWALQQDQHSLSFAAHGYGSSAMEWRLPWRGRTLIELRNAADSSLDPYLTFELQTGEDGRLLLDLAPQSCAGCRVRFKQL